MHVCVCVCMYNTPECGCDGGDCPLMLFNAKYPNCDIQSNRTELEMG